MEMKSKIKSKKPIDWSRTIVITDVSIHPKVFEEHKKRVDTVFANLSEEMRNQQLNNIILRDNIFNKAMDFLVQDYEFEIDKEELDKFKNNLKSTLNQESDEILEEISEKLIKKILIFADIQKENNITISDDELIKILNNYYEQTNQPIRDFMEDKEKFENAKNSLLEEKTTAFIIEKFPRDLSEFEKKLYESLEKKQKEEEQGQ